MKRPSTLQLTLGLGLLAAAGLVGRFLADHDSPKTAASAVALPRPELTAGDQWTYDLTMASHVTIQGGGDVDLGVKGTAVWSIGEVAKDGGATLLLELTGTEVTFTQAGNQAAADAMAESRRSLATGARVHLDAGGHLAAEALAGDTLAAQILKQAAALFQIVRPAAGNAADWTIEETDGTGVYSAHYTVTADAAAPDTGALKKGFKGYSRILADGMTGSPDLSGRLSGELDGSLSLKTGWLGDLTGKLESAVTLGRQSQPYSVAVTTVTIRQRGHAHGDVQPTTVKLATKVAQASPTAGATGRDPKADARKELDNATLNDVQQAEGKPGVTPHTTFIKTRAYVILHADDLSELAKSLAGRPFNDPWLLNSLDALASVGCDKCQELLVSDVAALATNAAAAETLAPYLAQADIPSVAAEALLRQMAQSPELPIRHAAELALGGVAFRLMDAQPDRADRIVQEGLGRLNSAPDQEGRLEALAALGNSGGARLPDAMTAPLADPAATVRAGAAEALRLCRNPAAVTALATALDDADATVREAAVDALGYQPVSDAWVRALTSRLAKDEVPQLRQEIISRLERGYGSQPEAKAAIDRAATQDPDQTVRNAAAAIQLMYPKP